MQQHIVDSCHHMKEKRRAPEPHGSRPSDVHRDLADAFRLTQRGVRAAARHLGRRDLAEGSRHGVRQSDAVEVASSGTGTAGERDLMFPQLASASRCGGAAAYLPAEAHRAHRCTNLRLPEGIYRDLWAAAGGKDVSLEPIHRASLRCR